jgi:hypothetical protein
LFSGSPVIGDSMAGTAEFLMASSGAILAAAIQAGGPGFEALGAGGFGGWSGSGGEGLMLSAARPVRGAVVVLEMEAKAVEGRKLGTALRTGGGGLKMLGELDNKTTLEIVGRANEGGLGGILGGEIAAVKLDGPSEVVCPDGQPGVAIAAETSHNLRIHGSGLHFLPEHNGGYDNIGCRESITQPGGTLARAPHQQYRNANWVRF